MKWLKTNWFLLSLVALALCAVPGVILVFLRLIGWDGDINKWLLDKCNITYDLRVPPWLALVLLLLPIVLIILYFLRLKRKPIQVPSTFLWKKSVEDLHVNSLFQWLRNNVLLILQLLVLLFLVYSVLGLRLHGATGTSRHYVLMIDNSASMSAKDVAPSRLEWAKAEALKEVDAASDGDVGMVIVFNSKASTLQTYTNDKEKLREAVRGIQQTYRTTRIEEALALAESLANPARSTEDTSSQPDDVPDDQKRTMVQIRGVNTTVHLFSDGRFAKLAETELNRLSLRKAGDDPEQGGLNLHYHMAGKLTEIGNTNNLAIVGLNVLRQPIFDKKGIATGQARVTALVRIANYRDKKASVRLKLDVHDLKEGLTHPMQQDVAIPERQFESEDKDEPGVRPVRFDLPMLDPGKPVWLHAYLDKPNDDFPLDDQAWLAIGTTRKAKVLMVGPPNRIFDAFFNNEATRRYAIADGLKPEDLTTEEYRRKARNGDYDWVIFDRCAPADEADMPMANTLFIDRPPPPWERGAALLKNPLVMPSKVQHPALRSLTTIWDVRVHEAFDFHVKKNLGAKAAKELELPDGDPHKRTLPTVTRIIETSKQKPLLFAMSRGPHTDMVMTFPLLDEDGAMATNWPKELGFPVFLRNVLHLLGNVDDAPRAPSVGAGDPVVLRPEAGFRELAVTTPNRRTINVKRGDRPDIVFSETDYLGIYRYAVDPNERDEAKHSVRAFAVNLLDANESNIEPRKVIHLGKERIEAGAEIWQAREIWKWILLVALLLILAEWHVYHRRIAV